MLFGLVTANIVLIFDFLIIFLIFLIFRFLISERERGLLSFYFRFFDFRFFVSICLSFAAPLCSFFNSGC